MATITVRNIHPEVQSALKRSAAANGRSMEAEVRAILEREARRGSAAARWLEAASGARGVGLVLPARTKPRGVDLA